MNYCGTTVIYEEIDLLTGLMNRYTKAMIFVA